MITSTVVQKIKMSTCAVIYMPIKPEDAFSGRKSGDAVDIPEMHVIGIGFLVQENIVLTNRHVIKEMYRDYQTKGNFDHWFTLFTQPLNQNRWSTKGKRIKQVYTFVDRPSVGMELVGKGLDLALISIYAPPGELIPVEFGGLENVVVGADVAICGFPFGNSLLTMEDYDIRRFGAMIHQGIISAVSPFDTVDYRTINSFLTDLNTAPGLSGSPIFLPESGHVIGLHFAGVTGKIGSALPVDKKRVDDWLSNFLRANKQGDAQPIKISPSGDIVD